MIKNLLFDLGGVIMNIDRNHCMEAFKKLGMENTDNFLGEYSQTGPFGDLESGKISVAEFHQALRPLLPEDVTDEQMDEAFSDFLLGIPEYRLNALKELRKKYKVYILSNTNPIMWNNRIASEFAKQGGNLSTYTDGAITSFEEKVMKPDARIFEAACSKLNIKPEETVFLDDSEANTKAAAALGFETIHVAPGTEFTELLKDKGL
ncbi:MAG: HAD family phosphatase [Paramuribaculum sp.]|nr:HAD family phosphatase [Paramuribaculum sp.]